MEDLLIRNAAVCFNGVAEKRRITFSASGQIESSALSDDTSGTDVGEIDAREMVRVEHGETVIPGLIELHTNGLAGVHFTTLTAANHEDLLSKVALEMATNGVTAWYATIPTVHESKWKEILPLLTPRTFASGSPLLGAHVEGPYLHPSKHGAHNPAYLLTPSNQSFESLYGIDNLKSVIKLITLAPELPGSLDLIATLHTRYSHIRISLGHSTADYLTGLDALSRGATSLTHTFNAMPPLQHREPGLVGLVANPVHKPFFSAIPDLVHLHPAILGLICRADPERCMLITDSIELAGLPDGIYPPNGQITYPQRKQGSRATNVVEEGSGEEETLIGSCITLIEGVKNAVGQIGLTLAEAVRCASGNVAAFMGDEDRGELIAGKRADFVIVDGNMHVRQTWIGGKCVFDRKSWIIRSVQANNL